MQITALEALRRLQEGNARYVAGQLTTRDFAAGRAALVDTQEPIAAVLACSDSRVAPELAFDCGPGDLFVVRVAGNFVNSDVLASLEYAVEFLGTRLIVVLGHNNCGAVGAAITAVETGTELPGRLPFLIRTLRTDVEVVLANGPSTDLLQDVVMRNVSHTCELVAEAGPVIAPRVGLGDIVVAGAVKDLATGRIDFGVQIPAKG